MYFKLEGGFGNYVSYADVDPRHLSKIVEIKFEGLKGNAFSGAARSVDWSKLTKLRKIEGVDSDLNSYTFPEKTFSNLEEIKFTKCGLSAETLNSLLDAVPNIETAQNFKFAWDVPSSISTADLFDDEEEEDAFQLASERIKIIQIAQKKHEQYSGETTDPDEDLDEDISLYSDSDTNTVVSSESGRSDSSELLGYLVKSEMDDKFLHQTEFDENEEIEITYSTNGSADAIMVSPSVFNLMPLREKSMITKIKINANGMPLLGEVSFDACTNLASLSISNAIIDETYLDAPLLPKLKSLNLDYCGVNVVGVGYFLNNDRSKPSVTMLNITKDDGDIFDRMDDGKDAAFVTSEFEQFTQKLQERYQNASIKALTASDDPLFGFYGEEDLFDFFSQTGTSHSDSERLEGHAVANASRLSLENVSQLDRLYRSGPKSYKAGMQIDGDEEPSVGSVQVRRLPEKNLKQLQDDQDAETLSTLSRGPNIDSGDSGSRRAVHVEPWEYLEDDEEEGKKSGLRAGGKQRTTHDLEDRSRSAAGVEVLVTYHPSTSANSSLSIDIPLTQEEFNNLSKSERAQIKALVITGTGPDGPDVGDTIDWSGLSRLEGLRLKGVTVEQPLPEEISFAGLKRIYFENCGVDSSAFESFSKASPILEEMDAKALYGLSIIDNSWRDLNESEKTLIRHTLEQENLYEPDFDSSIQSAPVSVVTRSYTFEEELKRGDSYHRSSKTISSVNAEDSGIFCFLGNETFSKLYSTLTDMELGQVTRIIYIGTGTNDNAMRQVDWSKLPSLRDVNIENAAVVGDHSFGDVKFSNLKSINFKNCRIGLSAIEWFSGSSSVQLSQFGIDHCVTNHDEERDDILRIQEKVNCRGLFPIKVGEVGELEDDDLDLDSLSEGENPRYTVPLPLSRSFTRNLKTAQPDILCYYSEERAPIPYSSEFSARFLPLITKIEYRGRGPQDNAMETVPWAKLTGLESLFISNASVSDATSFQGQGGKTLFPQLTKMSFDGCKLGPKAIDGFVKHASEDLTELNISSDCEVASESGLQAIEALKSRVNSRTQEDMGRRGMYSPGSNRSESSTPRSSSGETIHIDYEARNMRQPASTVLRSTVEAGLFPPTHVNRTTGGRVPPSVHTAGTTTVNVHGRYREFMSQAPELVVDNESENSRNYKKLVDDTAAALKLIKQENSFYGNNYRLDANEDEQTTSITYQNRDRMATPILDASIDTVKVHRGWRQVDRTISHETRAQIVLASLGIPPCPPDIAISNERSGLGQAIRAEFNKLKLRPDETDITVTIKRRR